MEENIKTWFTFDNMQFEPNSETELGEPQIWLYLSDGTSIEVTQEQDGLAEKDYFFSVRHHCSDDDFDNDLYHSTCGEINRAVCNTLDELQEYMQEYLDLLHETKGCDIINN